MDNILNFPKPEKDSWKTQKDILIGLLIEDGFDSIVAELAVDNLKKTWEILIDLPCLHIKFGKLTLSGVSSEQAALHRSEILKLCKEGVKKFSEEMKIVHMKAIYSFLSTHALELVNKK